MFTGRRRRSVLKTLMSYQTSVDEYRRVQTNQKKTFFDISGDLPRRMFFNFRTFLPQKLTRMKKFVFRSSRCTVVTQFFNQDFDPWNEVAKQKIFLSKQANFYCFRPTWKNFSTVQNGLEKRKNFYLIKLVSK